MGRVRQSRIVISALSILVGLAAVAGLADGRPLQARVVGVGCEAPRTLRLQRFEDGSAKLLCNGRVLVRVSVAW